MKPLLFAPFALSISALLLASCSSPLKSAYDLKQKAAASIGKGEGVPTVWNQATTPVIGQIYFRNQAVTPTSSVFVEPVKRVTQTRPVQSAPWVFDVAKKSDVEAQLAYMGAELDFTNKPVKSVHFSAEPGSLSEVREWEDEGLNGILNDPALGPKLRQSVLADMDGRKKPWDSHYWIVTSSLTAKSLKTTIEKGSNWNGTLKLVDADKLKALLGTSEIPSAGFKVGQQSDTSMSIGSTGETTLAVWMYPLSARKDGDTVWVYPDRASKALVAVNAL